MNCLLIETALGNGKSRYTCPNCDQEDFLPSGFAHAKRTCKKSEPPGPGTCLAQLLHEIGAEPTGDCQCFRRAAAMDANGIEWCQQNKTVIVGWLKEAVSESTWRQVSEVASKLIDKPWFRLRDPFGSMIDEAIRRAETQAAHAAPH